jgi:hypothetical protein
MDGCDSLNLSPSRKYKDSRVRGSAWGIPEALFQQSGSHPFHVGLELGKQRILEVVGERPAESLRHAVRRKRPSRPFRSHHERSGGSGETAVCRSPLAIRSSCERRVNERECDALVEPSQTGRPAANVLVQKGSGAKFNSGARDPAHHRSTKAMRKTVGRPSALVEMESLIESGFGSEHPDALPAVRAVDVIVPTILPL